MSDKQVEQIKQLAEAALNPPVYVASLTFKDGDFHQYGDVVAYKWDGVAFVFLDKEDATTFVPSDAIKTVYIEKDKNGTER